MTQQPMVLLVGLEARNKEIATSLRAVDRPSVVVAAEQIEEAFDKVVPLAVIAPLGQMSAVSEQLRARGMAGSVPFFVLDGSASHSMPPRSAEVTSILPADVDPGILALRLQSVLPSTGLPSASTAPASTAPASTAPASTAPASVSVPPVMVSPASTAPAPEQESSEAPRTAAAVVSARTLSAPAAESLQVPASDTPARSQRGKKRWLVLAALASAGAAGAAFMALSNPSLSLANLTATTQQSPIEDRGTEVARTTSTSTAPQANSAGDSPKTADLAENSVKPDHPSDTTDSPAGAEHEAPPGQPVATTTADPLASLFSVTTADTPPCEQVLDKTAADFETTKKWQAVQEWKLAGKSLMAGKQDTALEHMCRSAFIDATSPAVAGLVKFYLAKRTPGEALRWANAAVSAAPSAGAKRAAAQLLGDVLIQQGKVAEAREVWLESFLLSAQQTDRIAAVCRSFVKNAASARKGGDEALEERLLRRAAALQPEDPTAAALLARSLLSTSGPEPARRWAEHALELQPGLDLAQAVLDQLGS